MPGLGQRPVTAILPHVCLQFFEIEHGFEELGEINHVLADATCTAHLQPKAEQLFGDAVLGMPMGGGFFHQAFALQDVQLRRYGAGGQIGLGTDFGSGVAEAQASAIAGTAHGQGVHDHLRLFRHVFETHLVVGRGDVHQALEILDSAAAGAVAQ